MANAVAGNDIVRLMPLEVVILFSSVFVVVGFTRGVRTEAWITVFLLIVFAILRVWGDTLITYTNRIYRLSRFALAGGIIAENPVEVWQQFADMPPLIESDTEKLLFHIALLLMFYLLGVTIARFRVQRTLVPVGFQLIRQLPDLGERLLGAVLGGANGFLIAFFMFAQVMPAKEEIAIVMPETKVITEFMSENLFNILFVMIVIVILLGLMASGGIRQQ